MTNYFTLALDNIQLGAKTGCGVVISSILTRFIPLYASVFSNRAIEVGSYNIIQDDYYADISESSWKQYTDNFVYKGIFQSVKWLPNLYIQNKAKELFINNTAKAFLVPLSGMIPFFTIGAIEAITLKTETQKIAFSVVSSGLFISMPYISNQYVTEKTNAGGLYLSQIDTVNAQLGLISSFFVMDLAHKFGVAKQISSYIDLPTLTAVTLFANEAYNFVTDEEYTIWNSIQNILNEAMRVAAFSIAKSTAVVGVTLAYNNPLTALAVVGLLGYEGVSVYNNVVYEGKDFYETSCEAIGEVVSLALSFSV